MKFDPQEPHRRSIRLPAYDYSAPGAYFITIVAQGRTCLFGDVIDGQMRLSGRGVIADECWRLIPTHFPHVKLGAYVVMPNHVHGIIGLHDRDNRAAYGAPTENIEQFQKPTFGSIPTILRTYKAAVTRRIVQQFGGVSRVWQRNYYEHVIRDDADHNRIGLYIESNAVNWPSDDETPMR